MVARPELRQLAQRITARYHLTPLDAKDTAAYLRHRWRVAGGTRFPFEPAAVQRLHARAGGVPRLVNVIAERALLAGYARDATSIDAKLVDAAADEVLPPVLARRSWPWLAAAVGARRDRAGGRLGLARACCRRQCRDGHDSRRIGTTRRNRPARTAERGRDTRCSRPRPAPRRNRRHAAAGLAAPARPVVVAGGGDHRRSRGSMHACRASRRALRAGPRAARHPARPGPADPAAPAGWPRARLGGAARRRCAQCARAHRRPHRRPRPGAAAVALERRLRRPVARPGDAVRAAAGGQRRPGGGLGSPATLAHRQCRARRALRRCAARVGAPVAGRARPAGRWHRRPADADGAARATHPARACKRVLESN